MLTYPTSAELDVREPQIDIILHTVTRDSVITCYYHIGHSIQLTIMQFWPSCINATQLSNYYAEIALETPVKERSLHEYIA